MSKRFRDKRLRTGAQHKQRLRRTVQELYDPDADNEAWADALADPDQPALPQDPHKIAVGPPPRPSRPTRPPERTPSRTDAQQEAADLDAPHEHGWVVALGSGYCVADLDGEAVHCALPSNLARDQRRSLAVGDHVTVARKADDSAWVREVAPRRTELARPDPHNPRRQRVIAANVDVVINVASVRRPPLRPALIDRYLVATARSEARLLVCVNKIDLVPPEERATLLAPLEPYRAIGLPILLLSAETGEGLDQLLDRLRGQTAVFVGHSGVGKSSLVNALAREARSTTGAVSERYGTGRHTTTGSKLHRLAGDVRIIDTPGIRELGLWQVDRATLVASFPDIAEVAKGCRFGDCQHDQEPDCAVREAVERGTLDHRRFATFCRIRASLEDGPRTPGTQTGA